MSATQRTVYAGSYAAADKPGIYDLVFDAAVGALELRGAVAGVENPSFVAPHPTLSTIYAVSETGGAKNPGSVWALRTSGGPSWLALIGSQLSVGDAPCHLEIDTAGKWLVVSNYGSGSVAVLPILPGGALGEAVSVVQHSGSSVDTRRQESCHAHSAAFTPDGGFVIVADLGTDDLMVYAFDHSTGALTERARAKARSGAGPRHLAFHRSGACVYAANELDSTVAVYDYERGGLQERQVISTVPPEANGSMIADIHLNAAGDRLYVSNRGHDSIAVFDVAAGGSLSPIAIRPCGGQWPRNFAISPDDRFLLVANQNSGDISVLPVVDGEQALGDPVARLAVPGVSCVRFA